MAAEPQVLGHGVGAPDGLRQRSPQRALETEEEDDPLIPQEALTATEQRWAGLLALSCAGDLVASLVIIVVSWKYAYLDAGVSLWCMGIQALSHWLSSALLLMRCVSELLPPREEELSSGLSESRLLRERRRKQLYREQGLSTAMGLSMLIGVCALVFKAARKLKFWDVWYLDHRAMDTEAEQVTEWLAWTGFAIYSVQAVLRLLACCKLRMSATTNGSVISIVSLLFLFVLGLAASYEREWSWKAEPIAALVLSAVAFVEAMRVVICHFDDMDTRLKFDSRA